MAAQHLAAIKIQGAIRRFLYRKRKQDKKNFGSKTAVSQRLSNKNTPGHLKLIQGNSKSNMQHKISTTSE